MNLPVNLRSEAPPGGAPASSLETLLAEQPFLRGLSPHQARLLIDRSMLVTYAAGENIFRQGDPANRFYLIHRGRVALESHVEGGGATLVQTVGAGGILGWSWLFPPYYWHFDAHAMESTEAIFFYGTPLREECEADHDFGYELMQRMAEVMMERLQATRGRWSDGLEKRDPRIDPVPHPFDARATNIRDWGINE